jgi:hypothetical protein
LKYLKNKGHVKYIDNFYSSIGLFKDLRQNSVGACRMVCTIRKKFPIPIKDGKVKKGELSRCWTSQNDEMLVCICQDTGRVNILSMVADTAVSEVDVKSKSGKCVLSYSLKSGWKLK